MNRIQLFEETKAYEERTKPCFKEIIETTPQTYSNQRYLRKIKEYGLPQQDYDRCGVIPQLGVVWYAKVCKLFLWRYESNDMEEISTFSSEILFVDIFEPKAGIFNHKINYCLMVITEEQAMVYGVERDTGYLVNTEMVVSIPSITRCYQISFGNIFIGCADGNVYEIIYKGSESWIFKNMYLYDPNASIVTSLMPSILKRKKPEIKCMSANGRYLITLGKTLTIYNIEGGIYKVREVILTKEYISAQIVEDKDDSVFFYCVQKDGTRDFYTNKLILSKKCSLNDSVTKILNLKVRSSTDKYCVVHKSQYQGALVSFININDFQYVNYDKLKPSENQEIISFNEEVISFDFSGNELLFVFRSRIVFYEILTPRKYLTCNRIEDVYNVFKNFGERESLILYYQLISSNEDVSKIEYLCLKSEDNQVKCLSSLVYRELKGLLFVPIRELWSDERKAELERVQYKFGNILKKIKGNNAKVAIDLLDCFIQTIFYLNLLFDYSINLGNINLYKLLFCDEEEFKKSTLKDLIDVFKANQSIDPLINALGNKAPLYLPIDEVFYQRGFDLLKKYPSREKLWESLKNFRNIVFSDEIINKYNELGFYSGSLTLIRQHFTFSYEKEVDLLKSCVKCQGAVNQGLEDTREEFMYAFFEALCHNLNLDLFAKSCTCCDTPSTMTLSAIIKIQNPFLEKFLHEKTITDNDPRIFELHWKYLAFRNERTKAAKSLLYLAGNKKGTLEQRIDLLEKAKTVSLHTEIENEIKTRFELLDVQKNLIEKGVKDPIISNILLSADDLFNDYAYKYPSLALKIISISNFADKNVISGYWTEGMKGDFKAASNFLLSNKLDGPAMDLEIIASILIGKMKDGDVLGKVLIEAGFSYYDVIKLLKSKIKKENHPITRNLLINDVESLMKEEAKCNKIEKKGISLGY